MKELDDFTVERLQAFIDKPLDNGFTRDEQMALARIALAAKTAEPVTWWTGPEPTWTGELESFHDHETGGHQIPLVPALYSYPLPNSPELPDGWKLVPIEPTDNMLDEAARAICLIPKRPSWMLMKIYSTMLANAPAPEKQDGEKA